MCAASCACTGCHHIASRTGTASKGQGSTRTAADRAALRARRSWIIAIRRVPSTMWGSSWKVCTETSTRGLMPIMLSWRAAGAS
jgi:hypothetical protein